jgi:recombinational DNA repair protein (RecF pathway)
MGERLYRTTGVIIKRLDVGEADRVLTILTPMGKINANAGVFAKRRAVWQDISSC